MKQAQSDRGDRRKQAGDRTRDRLLTTALKCLAMGNREAVTLRQITDGARANVAAVSYHYGSLDALCDTAIELATEQYLDLQIAALESVAPHAGLDELAAAFAQPMVAAIARGGRDLATIQTVARVGTNPPPGWQRLDVKFELAREAAMRVLRTSLPEVPEAELIFRLRCCAGMLNWLVLSPLGAEFEDGPNGPNGSIARLLHPVLEGALRGPLARDC